MLRTKSLGQAAYEHTDAVAGADPTVADRHSSDIAIGDRLQIEKRLKKISQWYVKLL